MKKKLTLVFFSILIIVLSAFMLISCDNPSDGHTHEYEKNWSFDNTQHWHKCAKCNAKKDNAKHSFNNGVCSICEYNEIIADIPNTNIPEQPIGCNHEKRKEIIDYMEATCKEEGYSLDVSVCTNIITEMDRQVVCGTIFSNSEIQTDPIGRINITSEIELKNLIESGEIKNLLHNYSTILNRLPHTPVKDEAVPATCSTKGLTEGSHCDVCKTIIKVQIETDYTEHSYTDTLVYSSTTYQVCTGCGHLKNTDMYLKTSLNSDKNSYTILGIKGHGDTIDFTAYKTLNGLPITSIGFGAFQNDTSLKHIIIGGNIVSIGNNAFARCNSLNIIDFCYQNASMQSVKYINDSAFEGCNLITKIELPDTLTYIGGRTFYNCYSLKKISIPEKLETIYDEAFYGCTNLESINWNAISCELISTSVYMYNVFYGCNNLKTLTIGKDVTKVPNYLFKAVPLETITIPFIGKFNENEIILKKILGQGTLTNSSYGLPNTLKTVIITGGNEINSQAFAECESLSSITIPDSVTIIGSEAFKGCSSLTNICIPDSITNIGNDAFIGCNNLNYNEYENALYLGNKNNSYLVLIEKKGDISSININNKTKIIYASAFRDCNNLTNVIIPDSVISIGNNAFRGCNNLTSINIPNNTKNIGSFAFYGCSSLTNVTIPIETNSINEYAFFNCYSLTLYCEVASKPTTWSINWVGGTSSIVWDCNNNSKDEYGYEHVSIDRVRYTLKDGIASVSVHPTNTSGNIVIPANVIYNEITYNVSSIDGRAFYNCSELTNITISNDITKIGAWAFAYCYNLTSISFNGTTEQWNSIIKGNDWNSSTGDYTITCTNGSISKS